MVLEILGSDALQKALELLWGSAALDDVHFWRQGLLKFVKLVAKDLSV